MYFNNVVAMSIQGHTKIWAVPRRKHGAGSPPPFLNDLGRKPNPILVAWHEMKQPDFFFLTKM
jgi:hypothetical protein